MQGKWVRGLIGAGGAVAIVGCAVGSTTDDTATNDLANAPIEAGTDDEASVKLAPPAPPSTDDGGDAGSGGDGGGGGDAGSGGDGGADAGGGGISCNAPNACTSSTNLGTVSGDTGSDTLSQQGTTAEWLTVRVTENDNGPLADPLKMKVTLVSPPGANFDLYLYVPSSDTLECSAVSSSSTSTSSTDTASVLFGETGTFANGVDDSRTVTVEVRHVSGSCSPGAKWSLTLQGNTH
jgi:hypothetical protein